MIHWASGRKPNCRSRDNKAAISVVMVYNSKVCSGTYPEINISDKSHIRKKKGAFGGVI